MTFKWVAWAALVALPGQAVSTEARNCLSLEEGTALFTAMLPALVDSIGDNCLASLPADSFLAVRGPALIERYRAEAELVRDDAKAAAARVIADDDDPVATEMADQLGLELFAVGVAAVLAEEIGENDCPTANSVLAALEPLPPANIGMLIAAIMQSQPSESDDETPFKICDRQP